MTTAALLAAPATLSADALRGRLLLSWQQLDAAGSRTEGFRQFVDVRIQRALSDTLRLELGFRGDNDASGSTQFGLERTTDSRELQPRARLDYRMSDFSAHVDWDSLRSEAARDGERLERQRKIERLTTAVAYRPENLPYVQASGRRYDTRTPGDSLRILDEQATVQVGYEWRRLDVAIGHRRGDLEDEGRGFAREENDRYGRLAYAGSLWGERLRFDADLYATEGERTTRPLAGGTSAPTPVRLLEAFRTIDATPRDHLDAPLVAAPALRDGDLDTPAGVGLGPAAPANLNLAADLGRIARVRELRVVGRVPNGNPLPSGGAVAWDVYTSLDGSLWTPLIGASSSFDPARSAWVVTLPATPTRWIQVVSFFVNTIDTELTELEVFEGEDLTPGLAGTSVFDALTARGGVALRPIESVTLSWSALYNERNDRQRRELDLLRESASQDFDMTVGLLWRASAKSSLELRRYTRESEATTTIDDGQRVDLEQWLAVARWDPSRRVSTAAEVSTTETDGSEGRVTLERGGVRADLRFWDAMLVILDAAVERQENRDLGQVSEGPVVGGRINARLTRTLDWTSSVSWRNTEVSGGPALVGGETETRWSTELFWRPSPKLGLGGRIGEASAGGESRPLRGLQIEWNPFVGGAVVLVSRYDVDVDPLNDRELRRWNVSPRWRINHELTLFLEYASQETRSGTLSQDTERIYLALQSQF